MGNEARFSIATWNINSVRLRESLVQRFLRDTDPDVLCLQEIKSPADQVNVSGFAEAGWPHHAIRGQKGYNGVMILSKLPLEPIAERCIHGKDEARHIACRLANGITIENFYVPAGGYIADPETSEKFADKLAYLDGLQRWTTENPPRRTILVGDLNVAPAPDDVWSHRQLLTVVSHTPRETETLMAIMAAGGWTDITRRHNPEGKLYSWWSYRARDWQASDRGRRLDHIWASQDLKDHSTDSAIIRDARGWPRPSDHVPVLARFDLTGLAWPDLVP